MDFVFLCIDGGDAKKLIVEQLEDIGHPVHRHWDGRRTSR